MGNSRRLSFIDDISHNAFTPAPGTYKPPTEFAHYRKNRHSIVWQSIFIFSHDNFILASDNYCLDLGELHPIFSSKYNYYRERYGIIGWQIKAPHIRYRVRISCYLACVQIYLRFPDLGFIDQEPPHVYPISAGNLLNRHLGTCLSLLCYFLFHR